MPIFYMNRYISIKQILDDILDSPLMKSITLERAINYAVHFIQIVGMPEEFEEKTEVINIDNYRGILPCDYYEMIQVRTKDKHPRYYRYADDTFHMSSNKDRIIGSKDLTYKIQNNIIFTSTKCDDVEIAYRAIKVDKEGFPMIPENSSFINALEFYIKKRVYTNLFDQGIISSAVLQNVQQEYAWAVGQAQSDLIRPTIDQMESITNLWNQIIFRNNEHNKGFKYLGSREYIKEQ